MAPAARFVPHRMVRHVIPFHGLETAMTRSKTIDLMKVPSDPWDGREYLFRGMHFTPDYPTSCGWPVRLPRRCWTISE